MSWLNNSINSIKGQLTNLAQEVLAETAGPGDDDYRGPEMDSRTALDLLAETQEQKEQLSKACEDKDREIAALRKQITKLQNQKISDSGGGAGGGDSERITTVKKPNSKSPADAGSQQVTDVVLEDSWCWEPDNETTALGAAGGAVEQVATLKQRLTELEQLNKQLNVTLDDLDAQHQRDMQDVLGLKQQQQSQLTELQQANIELKQQQADSFIAHELALAKLQKQCDEWQKQQQAASQELQAQQQRLANYEAEVKRSVVELADLQQLLDKRNADNAELIERVRLAEAQTEKLGELELRVQQLLKELEAKEKKTSESSNSSSTGKHSEDEFIVVRETDAASSSDPTTPPTKEKLRDKLVALEARIAELTLENGSLALKLQDRELEKQLSSNVLSESLQELQQQYDEQQAALTAVSEANEQAQLKLTELQTQGDERREQAQKCVAELQSRLLISESEKEQLQLELQTLRNDSDRRVQQLTLQNQELKLNAEAEQETQADVTERQLAAMREENSKLRQELDSSIAQAKFRQAIAEEKQEITDLDEADDAVEPYDVHKLRDLLAALLNDELEQLPEQALERGYKALVERWQRVTLLEQRLANANEELVELQDHKMLAEHEKKTLEADISQYILQCDELMKNNEVLLNELDKFKRNKLETIEEHHEETIVQLEAQLEEATQRCSQLQTNEQKLWNEKQTLLQQLQSSETADVQLHDKFIELQSAKDVLNEEHTQMSHAVDELQEEKQQLIKQLEASSAELKQSEQLMKKLQAEKQSLLEQLESSEAAVAAKLIETEQRLEQLAEEKQRLAQQLQSSETETCSKLTDMQTLLEKLEADKQLQMQQLEQLVEQQDTAAKLVEQQEQNVALQAQLEQQKGALEQLQGDLQSKQQPSEETQQLQQSIETLNHEKAEMLKALQQKHAENTQYYAEIQRLQTLAAASANCAQCGQLEAQLAEMCKEREKLQDQINFLKEKSDILTTNLMTEQTNQRLLQQEKSDLAEQHAAVSRDLERLRAHLLEVEEMYTQETVQLQQELQNSHSRMQTLEQEVTKSSTAYTSASIRANQQAETLQAQHALLLQQRDELLAKISACEDRELKQHAALTNLQCALEQFQNDKQHDIEMATQRIRKEQQQELSKRNQLQAEFATLQQQLAEANQGLRAATRLSDQLEVGQQNIAALREEVETLKEHNGKLEQRLSSSESSQTDKIDKSLIKSLLIGYVVSGHAGDKQQVLRMISSVLDFNAQEADKVGLNKPQSSWLGAILGTGNSHTNATTQASGTAPKDNLVQAFVQFLEQESQPQSETTTRPSLLSIGASPNDAPLAATGSQSTGGSEDSVPPAEQPVRRNSPSGAPIQAHIVNSNEFAPTRNSSSILKDILSDS